MMIQEQAIFLCRTAMTTPNWQRRHSALQESPSEHAQENGVGPVESVGRLGVAEILRVVVEHHVG
jgi:hypothetical protein